MSSIYDEWHERELTELFMLCLYCVECWLITPRNGVLAYMTRPISPDSAISKRFPTLFAQREAAMGPGTQFPLRPESSHQEGSAGSGVGSPQRFEAATPMSRTMSARAVCVLSGRATCGPHGSAFGWGRVPFGCGQLVSREA